MQTSDELEIEALMKRYFDGLYHADSQVLRTVFHPELNYVNATNGDHEFMNLERYMDRIDNRRAPSARGEKRTGDIDRISLIDGQMALVEASVTMIGRDYRDLLTLIRTNEGWKVICKAFTHIERAR